MVALNRQDGKRLGRLYGRNNVRDPSHHAAYNRCTSRTVDNPSLTSKLICSLAFVAYVRKN